MLQPERTSHPSPWRGVMLLLATVTATELMMLNVIFWARAQAGLPGLVLAGTWPWFAAAASLLLWETRARRASTGRRDGRLASTRVSFGLDFVLAAIVLAGSLVSAA